MKVKSLEPETPGNCILTKFSSQEPTYSVTCSVTNLGQAIEIEREAEIETKKIGLTKQELMEQAYTPGWRRVRIFLSILILAMWLGLLGFACFLVKVSPKCQADSPWYQKTTLYEMNISGFDEKSRSAEFKDIINNMDYLKNLESSLLLSGVTGASLYNIAGNVAMFDEMVEAAHLNDVKVLVKIPIGTIDTVSAAFKQSAAANCDGSEEGVCGLFHWSKTNGSGSHALEKTNLTKSSLIEQRSDYIFYKGTKNEALINYDGAFDFVKSVINGWLKDRDVDGIYLTGIGGSSRSGISDETVDKIVKAAWSRVEEISLIDKKALFVEATDKSTSSRLSKLHGHGNSRQQEYPMIVYTPLAQAHSGLGLRFSEEVAEADESGNVAAFKDANETVLSHNQSLALTTLNLVLPGVSVLKLGKELGRTSSLPNIHKGVTALYNSVGLRQFNFTTFISKMTDVEQSALNITQQTIQDKHIMMKQLLLEDAYDHSFETSQTGHQAIIASCLMWPNSRKNAENPLSRSVLLSNLEAAEKPLNFGKNLCGKPLAKTLEVRISTNEIYKRGDFINTAKPIKLHGFSTLVVNI